MTWSQEVVANMVLLKGAGYEFDASWQTTLTLFPPRMRYGATRRQLRLTEEPEPSLADFMRERCREAWFGLRPELGLLGTSLPELFGSGDGVGTRAVSRNVAAPLTGSAS